MKKIDFFCIGAQKSGTSWLYYRLNDLSDFSLPYIKELHYFDRSTCYPSPNKWSKLKLAERIFNCQLMYNAILEISSAIYRFNWHKTKWMLNWHLSKIDDSWYESLFSNLDGITGDITPAYSILEIEDVKKMHAVSPDAKIIFLLRNPVRRAISQFRFYYQSRDISNIGLNDETIIEFIEDQTQTLRSNYLRTINIYSKVFKRSNILIAFYDAIIDQPDKLLSGIVNFLGGNESNIDSRILLKKINVSKKIAISSNIEEYLKEKYKPLIKKLSSIFGGYCKKWEDELNNNKVESKEYYPFITLNKIKPRGF